MDQWIDRGNYWEHTAAQGTDNWLHARMGRCTTTKSAGLVYHSQFSSPEKTGKIIAGVIKEEFSPESIQAMNHGTKTEPIARQYYSEKNNVKVVERNLVIPKNKTEMWLGASVDGDVIGTDGIIEIKCPKQMYKPILDYLERKEKGIYQRGYRHIWDKHLHQMMQGMYIMKKKWCDYIVYTDRQVFIQRVYFDQTYWDSFKIDLKKKYDLHVKAYLKPNYPISPN